LNTLHSTGTNKKKIKSEKVILKRSGMRDRSCGPHAGVNFANAPLIRKAQAIHMK